MQPILTVGFATYLDFDGAYMTVTGLRANHPHVPVVCVDTSPGGCRRTRGVVTAVGGRYYHMPHLHGTAASRDEVFRLAETPWVMVCDSHVVFETGAVQAVIDHAAANPDSPDLIQGPLVYDDGGLSTHWRQDHPPGLWGVWDYSTAGRDPRSPAFEVPAQGLGVYAACRARWPGFNPLFEGFGGEEGYVHEKVRRAGGRTLCLPALRWRHRFWDQDPAATPGSRPKYPLRLEDHTWNLLVGHRELGIDATAVIREHYGKGLPAGVFDRLVLGAEASQPWGGGSPPELRVAAVWYTNNAADPTLLSASLGSVAAAAAAARRCRVVPVAAVWKTIPGASPGVPQFVVGEDARGPNGHANICESVRQALGLTLDGYDVVCFLEHDVLYPVDYFDRHAAAYRRFPDAQVVSNLDYIGLNETGWLRTTQYDDPLHQLSMRRAAAEANLDRAAAEAAKKGWCQLEPPRDSLRWVRLSPDGRMPAVHVNHKGGRFTSHGEACYQQQSSAGKSHPYWGDAGRYWPAGGPTAGTGKPCGCKGGEAPAQVGDRSPDELYGEAAAASADFRPHMPTLRALADGCGVAAEYTLWDNKASVYALAASTAERVVSVCPTGRSAWVPLSKATPRFVGTTLDGDILAGVDLLFWDGLHRAADVYAGLTKYAPAVRRRIVVHCTTAPYGEFGDDGGPGVMPGVRRFLNENREWTAVRHDPDSHGLMVLSRDPADKHQPPGTLRKALNFAKALARHARNGQTVVSDEVFEARMAECLTCPERTGDVCAACGCPVDKKASWASETCGLVKLGRPPRWEAVAAVAAVAAADADQGRP